MLEAVKEFPVVHANKSKDYTRKAYPLLMHLTRFCQANGIKDLTFENFDLARLQAFDSYLASKKDKYVWNKRLIKKKALSSSSRNKFFIILKTAAKFNKCYNDALMNFSVPEVHKPSRALEWEEIAKIMDYEPQTRSEELTKDIFLFSCFTGMRITAIQNLKCSDIERGFIHWVNTKTTNKVVTTTIHKYNASIIKKYKNKGALFPHYAQQKLNTKVKDICTAAGIDKPNQVHNHTGRHSYNSLLYALGIDTFIRNEEVGHAHSSINEKVYTKLDDQTRKTIIVRAFDNLEQILQDRRKKYTTTFDDL